MKATVCFLIICFLVVACKDQQKEYIVQSQDEKIQLQFYLTAEHQPAYIVQYQDMKVIDSSLIGFELKNAPELTKNFKVLKTERNQVNENWTPFWGEDATVQNHYNELKVFLEETTELRRKLNIIFRVFEDGLGFRYEFPEQDHLKTMVITDEHTEFNLTGDHETWWIPGDWDIYEYLYQSTRFSEIDAQKHYVPKSHAGQTYVPQNAVNTPVTMKTDGGLYLSFHEADLTNYAGMTLAVDPIDLKMTSALVGNAKNAIKVERSVPFETPWRTLQIADKAGDLITSKMIVNLNDPSKVETLDYFKPMKYVGIWWDMHIGTGSWDYVGNHAATTAYAKEMIDFASENGIEAMLVEGWNTGWENWWDKEHKEHKFDFVTPYPDYNLEEVVRYGKEKGVALIMHHETSANVANYEKHMDKAFQLMDDLGIHAVKTGYVGYMIPKGEYHHGQWMVNHYEKVLEYGLKYNVAIDAHEPIKATGKRRTYPVAVSREGVRGQEYNAWSDDGGNPPEHLTIVPFTRMLAGPIDFTPGVFDLTLPSKPNNQINTTLAHQLASYVVIYSPVQMVPDLIKNYKGHPAFQFVKDVGVDWEKSLVLNGEIGEYITMARQEKETKHWFVGGLTNAKERDLDITFDFLDKTKTYNAILYKDAEDAHYKTNPEAYKIEEILLNSESNLKIHLAAGGGFAISIFEK